MEHEADYTTMLNHTAKLTETEQTLGVLYTKLLCTFSGGTIGLSITLVSGAFGSQLTQGFHYLAWSWVVFAICIVIALLSVRASQNAFKKDRRRIYEEYQRDGRVGVQPYRGFWVKATKWLERVATLAFISGVILIGFFVAKNLQL